MENLNEEISFEQAIKILGIEQYGERIFKSNSHGELFHLSQYIHLAKVIKGDDLVKFAEWFPLIVKEAEETWKRPESVFQHITTILIQNSQ